MNELSIITTKDVEEKLISLRNQKVLLDCDVADLYGVKTKEINQAVKNNPDKFPYGYIFVLDKYEKAEVVKNFDRLNKLKFSKHNGKASGGTRRWKATTTTSKA